MRCVEPHSPEMLLALVFTAHNPQAFNNAPYLRAEGRGWQVPRVCEPLWGMTGVSEREREGNGVSVILSPG